MDLDRCMFCGADKDLHRHTDLACPIDGREAPVGQVQSWSQRSTYCISTSPPPDVVEAARRLEDNDYLAILTPEIADIETVCKWVLNKAIDK